MVASAPFAAAVKMTFFTVSRMCGLALSLSLNTPVASRTMSTFDSPHGIFDGSRSWL